MDPSKERNSSIKQKKTMETQKGKQGRIKAQQRTAKLTGKQSLKWQ